MFSNLFCDVFAVLGLEWGGCSDGDWGSGWRKELPVSWRVACRRLLALLYLLRPETPNPHFV